MRLGMISNNSASVYDVVQIEMKDFGKVCDVRLLDYTIMYGTDDHINYNNLKIQLHFTESWLAKVFVEKMAIDGYVLIDYGDEDMPKDKGLWLVTPKSMGVSK